MRLQVTDLSLTTLEEPRAVRFVVTSLSSAAPVAGARVRVEGPLSGTLLRQLPYSTSFDWAWQDFHPGTTFYTGAEPDDGGG